MTDALIYFGVAVAVALIGGLGYWMADRDRRRAAASAHWPSTRGRVVSSMVRSTSTDRESAADDRFAPDVRYTYEVEGRTYQGRRITFGEAESGSRADAERWAARYPIGTAVDVHYDPAAPQTSILEPGAPRLGGTFYKAYGAFGVAALLCLLGLWSLFGGE